MSMQMMASLSNLENIVSFIREFLEKEHSGRERALLQRLLPHDPPAEQPRLGGPGSETGRLQNIPAEPLGHFDHGGDVGVVHKVYLRLGSEVRAGGGGDGAGEQQEGGGEGGEEGGAGVDRGGCSPEEGGVDRGDYPLEGGRSGSQHPLTT